MLGLTIKYKGYHPTHLVESLVVAGETETNFAGFDYPMAYAALHVASVWLLEYPVAVILSRYSTNVPMQRQRLFVDPTFLVLYDPGFSEITAYE